MHVFQTKKPSNSVNKLGFWEVTSAVSRFHSTWYFLGSYHKQGFLHRLAAIEQLKQSIWDKIRAIQPKFVPSFKNHHRTAKKKICLNITYFMCSKMCILDVFQFTVLCWYWNSENQWCEYRLLIKEFNFCRHFEVKLEFHCHPVFTFKNRYLGGIIIPRLVRGRYMGIRISL
jgi:hypothetical protein